MKILVVGDVMIDRFLHGSVERPNPDGRGAVFRVERVEESLGGAAAVARIVRGLGASVFLVGVAGKDAAGRRLIELLDAAGVSHRIMLTEDRVTTVKERRVAAGRLLANRVDYESRNPIRRQEARRLVDTARRFGQWDAVLVSDYGKGMITCELLDGLVQVAHGVPILIDPARGRSLDFYPAGALIKANLAEARQAAGLPWGSPVELLDMLGGDRPVVITAGADGIFWAFGNRSGHVPGIRVEQVVDVAGAGDTVLAVLGCCLAQGVDLSKACRLANTAARFQVGRLGVASIRPEEIGLPPLAENRTGAA